MNAVQFHHFNLVTIRLPYSMTNKHLTHLTSNQCYFALEIYKGLYIF